MNIELDHVFILVEPEATVADQFVDLGLQESFSRSHPGQGTSNRRFELCNSMIEFLWVRDADEAYNGPGKNLRFKQRSKKPGPSPFGLVLNRKDPADQHMPFEGWKYQPDYFEPPQAFHVGVNSKKLLEPLCIYVPFMEPPKRQTDDGKFRTLSHVRITSTAKTFSQVLDTVNEADRLSVLPGEEHLMEITLDNNRLGLSKDFRPDIPVLIHW